MLNLKKFIQYAFIISTLSFSTAFANSEHSESKEKSTNESIIEHAAGVEHHTGFEQPADHPEKRETPAKVKLMSPAPLSKISGTDVTLKWEAVKADVYHVQVATDPNFKWIVKNEFFVKGAELNVTGLESGKTYFWRVAGVKSENVPTHSKGYFSQSSFTVK